MFCKMYCSSRTTEPHLLPLMLFCCRFWFNFSVENVHVDQRIIFNIVNLSKTRNLFTIGLTPIVRSTSRPKWWDMIQLENLNKFKNNLVIIESGNESLPPMSTITSLLIIAIIMFYLLPSHLIQTRRDINLHCATHIPIQGKIVNERQSQRGGQFEISISDAKPTWISWWRITETSSPERH